MTKEERNEALFASLIMMFQSAALQHMGKMKNPATDAVERNLEQAQVSIDLLDMLEAKTRNNLNPNELKYLKNVIQELKLNYVDELGKEQPASPQDGAS